MRQEHSDFSDMRLYLLSRASASRGLQEERSGDRRDSRDSLLIELLQGHCLESSEYVTSSRARGFYFKFACSFCGLILYLSG